MKQILFLIFILLSATARCQSNCLDVKKSTNKETGDITYNVGGETVVEQGNLSAMLSARRVVSKTEEANMVLVQVMMIAGSPDEKRTGTSLLLDSGEVLFFKEGETAITNIERGDDGRHRYYSGLLVEDDVIEKLKSSRVSDVIVNKYRVTIEPNYSLAFKSLFKCMMKQ